MINIQENNSPDAMKYLSRSGFDKYGPLFYGFSVATLSYRVAGAVRVPPSSPLQNASLLLAFDDTMNTNRIDQILNFVRGDLNQAIKPIFLYGHWYKRVDKEILNMATRKFATSNMYNHMWTGEISNPTVDNLNITLPSDLHQGSFLFAKVLVSYLTNIEYLITTESPPTLSVLRNRIRDLVVFSNKKPSPKTFQGARVQLKRR